MVRLVLFVREGKHADIVDVAVPDDEVCCPEHRAQRGLAPYGVLFDLEPVYGPVAEAE